MSLESQALRDVLRENSIITLKEENDKLLKDNLELKKKLDGKSNHSK